MMNQSILKVLKSNYLKAKALYDQMESIDKEIKQEVINENEFMYAEESKLTGRITDYQDDYLMSDADTEIYIDKMHEKWLKYDSKHEKGTTTWKYKKVMEEAENKLLDYAIQEVPKDKQELTKEVLTKMKNHYEYRQKFLELTLKLAV